MSKEHRFTHAPAQLEEFAQTVLAAARREGASACECEVSEGYGLSVTVRKDEPESVEHNRDKGIGITVYFGERLSAQHSQFVFANSLGFVHGFPSSRHTLALSVIAEERGLMQRDDWYSAARVPDRLADPAALGEYAGRRALARLGARKIATCQAPVLVEA